MSQIQPPPSEMPAQQPMAPGYPSQVTIQQPPKKSNKRRNIGLGCGALVVLAILIAVFASLGNHTNTTNTPPSSNSQAVQTPQPTVQQQWTTTQTFTGNGIKKTGVFTVPDDWKLLWSCDPNSFDGNQYNLQVIVTSPDGTPVDIAVNTICKPGNTSDSTEEHQGGQVYLDVNSEGSWKLQVQELK